MGDRGVSTTLNYSLLLGLVAILVSTLIFGVGGLVDDQRAQAVQSEQTVVGNQLANDLTTVDHLLRYSDRVAVTLEADLPSRIVGEQYAITISSQPGSEYLLHVESLDSEMTAVVTFTSRTPIETGTVRGGSIRIVYDSAANEVVLNRD